jgi:hydrogenase large subunit
MCFKNLPIEFDQQGQAYLKQGVGDPFAYERKEISRDQIKELMARNNFVRSVDFDPVTRVAGALAFHSTVDLRERKVLESTMATLFAAMK